MASAAGTGAINDLVLGDLVDTSVVQSAPAAGTVDYSIDLSTRTFDVYVPSSYDGSEPYGLISFINSGNGGGQPTASYLQLMDDSKLIWIAGDGIGNSIFVDERMGVALMGVHRARELWNIDDSRVYAMGNSGGARSANMLAFQHPEMFDSAMPRCGANYIASLEQAYETQEPDGHYEYWGASYFPDVNGQPYRDYLLGFGQKFSLMTSRTDFREGDMMNIYHFGYEADGHFGYEADGFESRFLDIAGGHCSTNAGHFRDALNFAEHPLHVVIDEDFADGSLDSNPDAGEGLLVVKPGASESGGALNLAADSAVVARNRLHFDDAKGAIVRTELEVDDVDGLDVELALWPYTNADHGGAATAVPSEQADLTGRVGLMLAITGQGTSTGVEVWLSKGDTPLQVFSATFSDWDPLTEPLPLKFQVWDSELQINLGKHVTGATMETGTLLLNDQRSIRVRFEEFAEPASWWVDGAWEVDSGAVLTVANAGTVAASVPWLEIKDAVGIVCGD
jgi:pimeloyl-ACP methyl ester carboxylesterase